MKWTMKSGFLLVAMLTCLALLLPTTGLADGLTFNVSTSAVIRTSEDGRWRCFANLTLQNSNSVNVTLVWLSAFLVNVTFVNGTSQQLGSVPGKNFTFDPPLKLKPQDKVAFDVVATDAGFATEPATVWIYIASSFAEGESPFVLALPIVPEFPTITFLPLLMSGVLLVAILCRRRLERSESLSSSSEP